MDWVKLSSIVTAKRHLNAVVISPKGEAGTFVGVVTCVSKAKLVYFA